MRAEAYWERRYRRGGDSGDGSRGASAEAKAGWVNNLIGRENVRSVLDLGCGDGAQLALLHLDGVDYLGVDVAATAIRTCLERWPRQQFLRMNPAAPMVDARAELALSMDVMFHLPDEAAYHDHLQRLFGSATRLVAIHSTDYDAPQHGHHLRRRHFTPDAAERYGTAWRLDEHPEDPRADGFYLYRKRADES